ncbi:MAG: hypothetical protein R2750_09345 [Bacteroidales bacterium]
MGHLVNASYFNYHNQYNGDYASWLQLSIYSLPFNIIVLMFMYILKFRERFFNKPEIVLHQQFSPEKSLFAPEQHGALFRFKKYIPVILPFWGEWTVTQAHHGEYTHKEGWAHAWDFEIIDDNGNTFKETGHQRDDYYCFGKPVIAPADGSQWKRLLIMLRTMK